MFRFQGLPRPSPRFIAILVAIGFECLTALTGAQVARATVTFTDIAVGLPGVSGLSCGGVAWGDYDNDRDLDIVLTGYTGSTRISRVYRNDGGAVFTDIAAGLPGVSDGSVAWGDYDNDRDLDIVLTGYTGSTSGISRVYRNDGGGVFTDIAARLPEAPYNSVAWGDYDNDGDLDILLTGIGGPRVYRNDGGGAFADIAAGFLGEGNGSAAWGDYDNDGDLDILTTWSSSGMYGQSLVYRNDAGGVFNDIPIGLEGGCLGSVAWGDYDNDGDLDILLTGSADGPGDRVSRVYRNDGGGAFTDVAAGLTGVFLSSAAWGDYDNDGDLDIVLTGSTVLTRISRVYRNDGGSVFTDIAAGLTGVSQSSAAWGDYDYDGDLDILLTGYTGSSYVSRVYRNDGAPPNTPPDPPGSLSATVEDDYVTLNWSGSTDAQTPSLGLTYNLRIGTTPGGSEVAPAMADSANGFRRVVRLGNAQERTSWTVRLPVGSYYWSVQALDGAYAGSSFAPEHTFDVLVATQRFTPFGAGLPGVHWGSVAWGDYDNDGDLDILLTGAANSGPISRVYRNDGGAVFTDIAVGLPGVSDGSVAWGDYDNDGDLDILLTGSSVRVYRNDGGGVFTDIGLTGNCNWRDTGAWGDYDNDGDLDILLTGSSVLVYRNDGGGVFADIALSLIGVEDGPAAAWGDYDNDGDLDILLTGYTSSGSISRVYRNDSGGVFTDIAAGLTGVDFGSVAWGDYDNDGDLDVLLTGDTGYGTRISSVYRNDGGGVFTDIAAGLPGVDWGSAVWGDCDNDGDLDILLTGATLSGFPFGPLSRLYHNDGGGVFTYVATGLNQVSDSEAVWGDYDNDGDLDILLTGLLNYSDETNVISCVYRNDGSQPNTPPDPPGNLTATVQNDYVTLNWSAPTDAQTPSSGLTYNLRIGTTPGGNEVAPAMANSANGLRRVPRLGSAQERTSWTVRLPVGSYYWSVQALDAAYAGSSFGQEQTFEVLVATTRFTDIAAGLPGVAYGSVAWGDYDNDGDLDILLTGDSISRVYRNDGGGMFTDTAAGLTGVGYGSVAWGDYDNDGDLDILLTGASDVGQISRVYRNDGDGVFTDLGAALIGVEQGSGAWGDYDNDGDLDIVLTGYTGAGLISCVYRNEGEGVFTDIAAGLPGAGDAVAWGDYDHDGDLDILGGPRVYRNDGGGVFTDINAGLSDVSESSVAWGDYDNDGDLDFLLTGLDNTYTPISRVYRNDGPAGFTDIGAGLIGVRCGSVAWGDYDNDGDLDILLPAGISGYIAHAYRNDGGNVFTDIAAGLTGVPYSSAAWGDYDNDGDLDILLVGEPFSRVYRNDGTPPNTPPAAPTDLSAQTTGDLLTLFWSAAVDGQTPVSGLSYNLRVGTTPGGSEIMPAMAHAGSGYRRVVQLGNAQERTSWTITVPPRVCYWSVQSIDAAFAASPFAAEQSISPSGAEELAIPTRFLLRRCAPNPFTLATVVSFELPASSPIKLEVYEVSGRCVRTLVDEARAAGRHRTVWDGTDDRGRLLAGGTYFCRMVAREFNSTTRMTLIR